MVKLRKYKKTASVDVGQEPQNIPSDNIATDAPIDESLVEIIPEEKFECTICLGNPDERGCLTCVSTNHVLYH